MLTQHVILAAALVALASAACAPQNPSSDELARGRLTTNLPDGLSKEEIEKGRILTEGITGTLINLNADQIKNECPAQLSKWNSAIGFTTRHDVAPSGFHATAEDALRAANIGLPSMIRGFVCFDMPDDTSGSLFYNVSFRPGAVQVAGKKATFAVEKSGGGGYKSALTLEVTIEEFEASAELDGRKAKAKYYAVDSVKLVSSNKVDQAELTFGRKESDILQVKKNLEKFLQDNPTTSTGSSSRCSNTSAQEIAARFTFNQYRSDLARLASRDEAETFTTEVSLGGQLIDGSRKEHDLMLSNNRIDLTFALAKAGRYTFKVTVLDPSAGSNDTNIPSPSGNPTSFALAGGLQKEVVAIDFRVQEKDCKLEWVEAISPSEAYTLERR